MIALFNRIGHGVGGSGALLVLALLLSTPARAGNNAAFSSQSVPSTMVTGGDYIVSVSMTNTGTTTWPSGTSHLLGSQNPRDNVIWGGGRAALSAPVAPGQTTTIAFHVTAPSAPGTYNFQWKMLQEYVEWFGATSPNVAVVVNAPSPVNGAAVTAFSAPATMTKGQTYPVAVTMQNTGNTTWPAGGAYLLGSKNPNDNLTWGVQRVALSSSVAPGQQATFDFQVVAPTQGTYSMQWGMVQEYVQWFGATASATVTVGAGTGDTVTYIHTDGLGSPVARTDASGKVISRTRYEPYGLTASGDVPSIGFTGHVNDADTGLVYMQQRYYDPVAGRFLSIDPVTTDVDSGGSFNRYAYANNSPYQYVDPDGRNPWLLRAGFEASYFVATRAGAGILGSMIGIAIYDAIHSDSNVDKPGTAVGTGCIYCVSGDKTNSGKDYIGSTDDMDKRKKDTSDGRDRNGATIIDTYPKGDKEERRTKEQQAINDKGGKSETDNRRNEIAESKWPASGVKPPEPRPDPPKRPESN